MSIKSRLTLILAPNGKATNMGTSHMITHIDPSIGTLNLGDLIIADAVDHEINLLFPEARRATISSRDLGSNARQLIRDSDYSFLGGTNLLSANPLFGYRQFSTNAVSAVMLKKVTLLGVGWWQYQKHWGPFAQSYYKRVLRSDTLHSVRDEYTRQKLESLGINNVVNTGCPTMWRLKSFSNTIGNSVIFTLTDYNKNIDRDRTLLSGLLRKFETVRFWPQGRGDLAYINSIASESELERIEVIAPTTKALGTVIDRSSCYIGTRLHAGIRALQLQRPSFIVPIDNRAVEIGKSDPIHLTDPELKNVRPGAKFTYVHSLRPTVEQFKAQFSAKS
jgi:hypothetical protein